MLQIYRIVSSITIVLGTLVTSGCNASEEAYIGEISEYSNAVDSSTEFEQMQVGAECGLNYKTRPCFCNKDNIDVPGRQVCFATIGWSACECSGVPESLSDNGVSGLFDPDINKGAERFDWQRTIPTNGSCESGHYDGAFDGIYIPAITFGFGPIPVFGNVSFDLGKTGNGEFFEVENGHMIGAALVAFAFEGDIVGKLDCNSGFFEGTLTNCYYIIPGLPAFAFEGIIRARYDKINHAFVNGVWSVTEIDITGSFPPPLEVNPGDLVPFPPPLGGTGTWSIIWVP